MVLSSDEDSEFKPQLKKAARKRPSTGSTAARKPGRGGVACASCRGRKVQCDLVYPACGTCQAKGEEDSCSFQSLLWFDDPSEIPSAQLKAKLDRLESNILKLRSNSQSSSVSHKSSPKPPARAVSAPSSFASETPRQPIRRASRDVEVASRLLVGSLNSGSHQSTVIDFTALVAQLEHADAQIPTEPVPHLAEPTSLLARPTPEDLQRLMQLMPTHRQATAAIRSFFARVNPIFHALHRPNFDAQCSTFWQNGATNDGKWLASYLGVCGNGLLAMTEDEATACSMPAGEGRGLLVRSWMDGALQALSTSGFAKDPLVEGLRAVVLLNTFWASWSGGKHLESGLAYSTTAISALWELDMHRDPDELNQDFSPLEAEERRRIFWALFSLDSMARSVLGKAYQPLDISSISCRLPSELGDSSYSPTAGQITYNDVSTTDSASMASVVAVHSACLLLAKISKAAGRTRSTSDDVSALHEELDALLHRPSSSSRRPSTPAAEPFASVLTSFAQIRLVGSFPDLHQTPDVQQSYVTHAVKLLDQVKGVVSASPVVSVYTSIAAATAAIALGFNALEPSPASRFDTAGRLAAFRSTLESSQWPTAVARIFSRGSTISRILAERADRQRQASGFVMPAGSFLGVGQSHSPTSTTSGYDHRTLVEPPYFMPQGSSNYLHGEQYLSPLPYSDYSDALYHHHSPNLSGDFGAQPVPSHGGSFDSSSHDKRTQRQVGPLLQPWLTSTATLVSPIAEFSTAAWSRGEPVDLFA